MDNYDMRELPIAYRYAVGLRRFLRFVLALACGWISAQTNPAPIASPVPVAAPENPANVVITTFDEYWREGVRDQARPIKLEMIIDYYDGGWNHLWAESGAVLGGYMPCAGPMPFRSRDRVLVEGTVVPRKGLLADTLKITILEHDVPATPMQANGQLADFMKFQARVVTFEATVDQERIDQGDHQHWELLLVAGSYRVHLYHWSPQPKLMGLRPGARVKVSGIYVGRNDPQSGILDIDLWVAKPEDVVFLTNPENDPRFEIPIEPINRLVVLTQQNNHRTRIAGQVRSVVLGQNVVVRDETGEVIVKTVQTLPLVPGDWVEAFGDPYASSADWLLRRGIVRRALPEVIAQKKQAAASVGAGFWMADQILALSPLEADKHLPASITGVIIWSSPNADFVYLHDNSGTIRVQLSSKVGDTMKANSQMKVTGVTVAGPFAPELKMEKAEQIGSVLLPQPKKLTLEQAMTGLEEGQIVELSGHVQKVSEEDFWTVLLLSTQTGSFTVRVSKDPALHYLQGSIVSVSGVCRAIANKRRQLTTIEILSTTSDDLRVERVAQADPFAEPLTSIAALRQFRVNSTANYWSRVKGVVTYALPGRYVVIQDGAEGLLLRSEQTTPLQPGDYIEVTGLPGRDAGRVILRESVYRKLESQAEPKPVDLKSAQPVFEELDSVLVTISGKILSTSVDAEGTRVFVKGGDGEFTATLAGENHGQLPAGIAPGSRVRLLGVYEVLRDDGKQARNFNLRLRVLSDITVLETPSWWTPVRAFAVTAILLVSMGLGFAWAISLRRRVQQQTDLIRVKLQKEANLEAHNRAIVSNASDAIFAFDPEGFITSINPAGERLLGYGGAELVGMSLHSIISLDQPEATKVVSELIANCSRGPACVELRLKNKKGDSLWTEVNACLVQTEEKQTAFLAIARDIGARKQIESELRQARDAAHAIADSKSIFLANMSHEIRTPMNGVIGMSNILLESGLSSEQRDYAQTIRNSAESLLTVLNDILDFSKIEAGKLHFENVDFNLWRCLEEPVGLLKARASEKGISLTLSIARDVPRFIKGDPGRLRQVVVNLLGNAIKFTAKGGVVITVATEKNSNGGAGLRFEIKDSGVGIDQEAINRLFRPFSQADASTTRRYGGTGLGLAICKQIVDLMGGAIGVESKPGEGSTFWFTAVFPLASEQTEPAERLKTKTNPQDPSFATLKVLVAEDNLVNQQVVLLQLKKLGLAADVAANGAKAVEAAKNKRYDIILMDCQMPEMDGYEAARIIREDAANERIRIIAMTANAMQGDREKCFAAGMNDYMTKPLRLQELRAALARAESTLTVTT